MLLHRSTPISEVPDTTIVPTSSEFKIKLRKAIERTLDNLGNHKISIVSDPEVEYLRIPNVVPIGTSDLGLKLLIIPDNLKDDINIYTHDTRLKCPYKIKGGIYVELDDALNPKFRNKYSIPFI